MRRRHLFSGVENFALFDFDSDGGWVDENVFAYSNRHGDEGAVILFNNAYEETAGRVRLSTAINRGSANIPAGTPRLAAALGRRADGHLRRRAEWGRGTRGGGGGGGQTSSGTRGGPPPGGGGQARGGGDDGGGGGEGGGGRRPRGGGGGKGGGGGGGRPHRRPRNTSAPGTRSLPAASTRICTVTSTGRTSTFARWPIRTAGGPQSPRNCAAAAFRISIWPGGGASCTPPPGPPPPPAPPPGRPARRPRRGPRGRVARHSHNPPPETARRPGTRGGTVEQ